MCTTVGTAAKQVLPIVKASKSENTITKHELYFKKFKNWCSSAQLNPLPAAPSTVNIFVSSLVEKRVSTSVLYSYFYSIKWHHDLSVLDDPCLNKIVLHTLEGSKRLLSKPVVKKEPTTAHKLCDIYDKYGKSESISDLRVCTACLLGSSGCFRYQELVSIKMSDFSFFFCKTDIYRQGNKFIIATTGNNTCTVICLEHYIRAAKLQYNSDQFLYRPIVFHKNSNSYCLSSRNVFISYTRARKSILNAFISIGLGKSKFGLHSLRSGGATVASANGVPDRLFKTHGRWKSEKAKRWLCFGFYTNKQKRQKKKNQCFFKVRFIIYYIYTCIYMYFPNTFVFL